MSIDNEIKQLTKDIKQLALAKEYEKCEEKLSQAMYKYPHRSEPHNLWGVIFMLKGDKVNAMKHFRASYALDPTYEVANYNLFKLGSFIDRYCLAFDESDLVCIKQKQLSITTDSLGIRRVLRSVNYNVVYDKFGIGHIERVK